MKVTLEQFLFDFPLYTETLIDDNLILLRELSHSKYSRDIDGYNPYRKVQTTFKVNRQISHEKENFFQEGGIGQFIIECKRYGDALFYFCNYDSATGLLMKVGQLPSVADLHTHEIKQYKEVLSDERIKEFTRAIGLASHGIGIGSFVYLRRIFESLISEAFMLANTSGGINIDEYNKARMGEKIELLKSYLPSFLVEHKEMYSILSLGIHELNEETCLEHFDTLRVGIELILDEKLGEARKKAKIEEAKAKLKSVNSKIKKKSD